MISTKMMLVSVEHILSMEAGEWMGTINFPVGHTREGINWLRRARGIDGVIFSA